MDEMLKRFKKYIKIDTMSDEDNNNCPSSKSQIEFGKLLVEDMKEIGIKNAHIDEHGYVYGSIKSNIDKKVPTVGFIAHMDTSPDFKGGCTNPKVFKYTGGDIVLNEDTLMTVKDFPFLKNLIGETLITTDGTTLLGADDKAGLTEIMEAMKFLIENPSIPHGDIKIGFTPDEEIGRGSDLFNIKDFNADFAYTVDGGPLGEFNYENFNAASAKIKIKGRSIHPGDAKKKLINSSLIAMEIQNMLPVQERPEFTENHEGFFLLDKIEGNIENTSMSYIIRDHDLNKFNEKKNLLKKIVEFLNVKYNNCIDLEIKDSYFNMKELILKNYDIVDLAINSMKELNIVPKIVPIRGGTDGARLTFDGLPCPNLFTGGYNYHGRFELASLDTMIKSKNLIIKICENLTK